MHPRKFKKPVLLAALAFVLPVVAGGVLWNALDRPSFEVTPLSIRPAAGSDSLMLFWGEKRRLSDDELSRFNVVRMRLKTGAGRKRNVTVVHEAVEVRLANQWVKIPDAVFVDVDNDDMFRPHPMNRLAYFLVPREARACRVRLTYQSSLSVLPLGFGTPEPRLGISSAGSQRALRFVESVSPRISRWLWPDDYPLKTGTVEVSLANLPAATLVKATSQDDQAR